MPPAHHLMGGVGPAITTLRVVTLFVRMLIMRLQKAIARVLAAAVGREQHRATWVCG